jgi:hypothetical protein
MRESRFRAVAISKLAILAVAVALAFPLLATSVGRAQACSLVWTNLETSTFTVPDNGAQRYTSTVKYYRRFDTCRLGVYDKLKVLSWTNQLYYHASIFPTYVHKDYETAVMSNFSNFATPGPIAYFDGTDITRTGDGYLTRGKVLSVTYNYDKDFAILDSYLLNNGAYDESYAFKFLQGKMYCRTTAACKNP